MSFTGDTQGLSNSALIEQELLNLTEQIKMRLGVFFEQQSQIDALFTENLSAFFNNSLGCIFEKNSDLAALTEENARLTQTLTENRDLHVEIQKHLAARKGLWSDGSLATQDIN